MGKKLLFLLSFFMVFAGFPACVDATSYPTIGVQVNGRALAGEGIVYRNRTLIPLRAVSEELDCKVDWIPKTRRINIQGRGVTASFQIDSPTAYYSKADDSGSLTMDTTPIISNGHTYVPLRYLGEVLNCNVRFDKQKRVAKISKSPAIYLHGKDINQTHKAYIENGTTFVGIRMISENLGYHVDYYRDTDGAIRLKITGNGHEIRMAVGQENALVDGRVVVNPAPVIWEGTTYVPLRFISEAFGTAIDWDQGRFEVTIRPGGTTPTPAPTPEPQPKPEPQPHPTPEPAPLPHPKPGPLPEPKLDLGKESAVQPKPGLNPVKPKHRPYTGPRIYHLNTLPVRGKEDAANYLADSVLEYRNYL